LLARYTDRVVKILLLGTYELGRQPFGLASPAAWLRKRGHSVHCCDLSRQQLEENALHHAQCVVFYLPMHTATRLAVEWAGVVRTENPAARLVACGLYAPLNAELLREVGFSAVLGPEFEADLCALADALSEGREVADSFGEHAKFPRLSFETQIALASPRFPTMRT